MNSVANTSIPGSEPGQRFLLVDALRGIAAVGVLFHHLLFNSILQIALFTALPFWFTEFCQAGAFGVEIFFVISGFVITHSLRNVPLNLKGVGNFMLRRQLRLDPPYWTVLLVSVICLYVERHVPWIEKRPMPSLPDIGANMAYLHVILGIRPIVGVAWTLCLEVQFYLVFILLLLAGKLMSPSGSKAQLFSVLLVAALAAGSLVFVRRNLLEAAWFIQWWFYFAAGVLCYWAVNTPAYRFGFIGFLIVFLAAALFRGQKALLIDWGMAKPMLIAWTTTVLLYVAGRMGKLTTWLRFAPLQYLGKISYSLYLSHMLVSGYVLRLGFRLTHHDPASAVFWFFTAGAISLVAAHGLYLLIEQRSVKFAARFKLRDDDAAANGGTGLPRLPKLQNA